MDAMRLASTLWHHGGPAMTIQEQLAMRSQGHNISTRFTADGIGTQPVVVSFAGAETTIWEMGDGPGLSVGSSGAILELPRRVG